jgi:hypothetical protein
LRLFPLAVICALIAAPANALEAGECFGITYIEPTSEYGHGVLGDGGENKALEIRRERVSTSGEALEDWIFTYRLPEGRLFEDLVPHCADLDGDGLNEIIVVESDIEKGAQLAVYDAERNVNNRIVRLAKVAATPPIGRAFRWLAVAGIADFDGDGGLDVAYVETPHIGGVLHIWTLRDGALALMGKAPGYSNHRTGQDFITGGLRDCGKGPELVMPNADWSKTLLTWFGGGEIESVLLASNAARATVKQALDCQ